MNVFRSVRRFGATANAIALASASLLTAGVIAASPGVGLAATSDSGAGGDTVSKGTQACWLYLAYDAQTVAVADASTSPGARVIQWDNNGGSEWK